MSRTAQPITETRQQAETDHTVRSVAKQAVLYCDDCHAIIPYGFAATGPVKNWPYCPAHKDKPLAVRSPSYWRRDFGRQAA